MGSYLKLLAGRKIQLGVVLFLTLLVYVNTIKNQFVIEDPLYISEWHLTQNLANIPKMFAGDTAPTGNVGIYRPLRAVFYALSYRFLGTNPLFYRLQALLVHLIIVVFIYLIADLVLKKKFSAFLVALLFGLHPVHTEAVDYLTANFDTVAYIFFFGAFYFYLRSFESFPKFNPVYFLSLFLSALAFFHFEMTLTLPLLLLVYNLLFLRTPKGKKFGQNLKILGPYFLIAAIYLFIRFVLLKMTTRGQYLEGSFYLTMLTMLKVFLKYMFLLIFPLNLSINPRLPGGISAWPHALSHLERIRNQTIFDPFILLSVLVIAGLLFLAIYFRKKQPLIAFSLCWIFLSLIPVSYVIPQGTIFQERYIYVTSFGFILVLVYLFERLFWEKNLLRFKNYSKDIWPQLRLILVVFILAVTAFYSFVTYSRNRDWRDSLAVWSKLAKQYPDDVIANFDTAKLYAVRNNFDLAVSYYQKALAIEPKLQEARFGLGNIYAKEGDFDKAATELQQALLINPEFQEARELLDKVNGHEKNPWKSCQLGNKIIFSCPKDWEISPIAKGLKIEDSKSTFSITISYDTLPKNQTGNDYLKNQKETFGTLENQGLANFPNFDTSFLKIFNDKDGEKQIKKFQFFLFKRDYIIKTLVYPADSPEMVKFDRLITSLKIS